MTTTIAPEERNGTEDQTMLGRAAAVVADVATQVQTAAADATSIVAEHAPAALAASTDTVERVVANLGRRSDASLAMGTVFGAGLSAGMLLARAPRVLVAVALLATSLIGGTLVGRGAATGRAGSHGART